MNVIEKKIKLGEIRRPSVIHVTANMMKTRALWNFQKESGGRKKWRKESMGKAISVTDKRVTLADVNRINIKKDWEGVLSDLPEELYNHVIEQFIIEMKERIKDEFDWDNLLDSIKEHGYSPKKFNDWIILDSDYHIICGNHRIAALSLLHNDEYEVDVKIADCTKSEWKHGDPYKKENLK